MANTKTKKQTAMTTPAAPTTQLHRLILVHRWLSGGTISRSDAEVDQFAAQLKVNRRTVYRDIAALRELYAALGSSMLD